MGERPKVRTEQGLIQRVHGIHSARHSTLRAHQAVGAFFPIFVGAVPALPSRLITWRRSSIASMTSCGTGASKSFTRRSRARSALLCCPRTPSNFLHKSSWASSSEVLPLFVRSFHASLPLCLSRLDLLSCLCWCRECSWHQQKLDWLGWCSWNGESGNYQ
jgi:hypothetical protein